MPGVETGKDNVVRPDDIAQQGHLTWLRGRGLDDGYIAIGRTVEQSQRDSDFTIEAPRAAERFPVMRQYVHQGVLGDGLPAAADDRDHGRRQLRTPPPGELLKCRQRIIDLDDRSCLIAGRRPPARDHGGHRTVPQCAIDEVMTVGLQALECEKNTSLHNVRRMNGYILHDITARFWAHAMTADDALKRIQVNRKHKTPQRDLALPRTPG
ncbi:MAG: hypothetical protein ABSB59_14395 [Streptosporangiaceae bacterium]